MTARFRIVGTDLPGLTCGPSDQIQVGVQPDDRGGPSARRSVRPASRGRSTPGSLLGRVVG